MDKIFMFYIIACFLVLTITLVESDSYNNSDNLVFRRHTRRNACIGGNIELRSRPANLKVTNDNCNVKYDMEEWELEPVVKYHDAKNATLYLIIMIDPDVPNLEEGAYYLHWLLVNIEGSSLRNGSLKDAGYNLAKYKGPAPQKGTGFHKYQFLIYRQEENPKRNLPDLVLVEEIPDNKRNDFLLKAWFRKQAKFTKLVGPLAGVQFLANFWGKQFPKKV